MKITVFQHTAREPPGYLAAWFAAQQIPVTCVPLHETHELRHTDATHFIFLGGPMSVNDEREYPWLAGEKALIRKALRGHRRVLGICLGAQLIASALGAPVYPCRPENGWQAVVREPACAGVFSRFPPRFHVFQMHGETFQIPYKAARLCTGERVPNQAFSYKSALGLQFHLELTAEIVADWCRDLRPAQQAAIARDTPRRLAESNRLCRLVAEDFIGS